VIKHAAMCEKNVDVKHSPNGQNALSLAGSLIDVSLAALRSAKWR